MPEINFSGGGSFFFAKTLRPHFCSAGEDSARMIFNIFLKSNWPKSFKHSRRPPSREVVMYPGDFSPWASEGLKFLTVPRPGVGGWKLPGTGSFERSLDIALKIGRLAPGKWGLFESPLP